MKKILKRIEQEIGPIFDKDSTGHDLYHLKRTQKIAMRLQKKEGGDALIIAAAAILHDFHRAIEHQNKRYCSPKESLPMIKTVLEKADFPKDKIDDVLHCIEHHEDYSFTEKGKTATDIETLIIQDADNIDSMGAMGISRTFMYAGTHNRPLWMPDIPIKDEHYDDSDKGASTIHHFYQKLLRLKENLNTKTAKNIGEKRHRFMEKFLDEFFKEWDGKR